MSAPLVGWIALTPVLILLGSVAVVMTIDLLARPGSRLVPMLALTGLVATLVSAVLLWGTTVTAFDGAWRLDDYALFFYLLVTGVAAVSVVLTLAHEERRGRFPGEYWSLLLLAVVGMMAMVSAGDLVTLIIGLETMSLSAYVLVGLNRGDPRTSEGALKYFLLGAFASAFLLYGTALVYGASGTISFERLAACVARDPGAVPFLLQAGAGLLLVGLGFKVAAVPFHMWAPDAYQAAPTPVTGFMATAVKAAGFAALLRVFGILFAWDAVGLRDVLWIVAALSMLLGNLAAAAQANLKRMLAYSSIAHVGYLLTAVLASRPQVNVLGGTGVLFYLSAYALMTLGAFAVLVLVGGREDRRETLPDFAGLAARRPGLALAMTLFMVSLSGIPPTAGFFGKFYVFGAAVDAGLIGLATLGVLTSVVGVFYYLRVVVYMYMKPPEKRIEAPTRPVWAAAVVALLALLVLAVGLFPEQLLGLARAAFTSRL
jgi:NADH-quinone oxidoreductase subunit N